jgi:hypothetical protein
MKYTHTQINWNDKEAEKVFNNLGIKEPNDLINIEKLPSEISVKLMRRHIDKETGKTKREMNRLEIDGKYYFLKRTFDEAYENIQTEYDAICKLPDFDFFPPEVAAYYLNEEKAEGFILLNNLDDFYSIKEILNGDAPDAVIEYFKVNKESILTTVAERLRVIHKAGYRYPDIYAKHVYIKKDDPTIALIDLERFRHLKDSPLYFSLPIANGIVRKKFWKKFYKSLVSDMIPAEFLDKILHD